MKKKIVQFIYGLKTGGAETLVKNYALGFDKSKYDVVVLCLERNDTPYNKELAEAGIEVLYACDRLKLWGKKGIIPKVVNRFQLYFAVRKILKEISPDFLHTHLLVNEYVKFAGLPRTTRIFHTLHNELDKLWTGNFLENIDLRAAKWLVKHHDMRLIALHENMKKEADKLFGVDNTIVVNNGIYFSNFEKVMDKSEARALLNIPQNAFVLGHVGRFSEQKNHVFLINVFLEVYKQEKNAYLLMVGNGSEKEKIMNTLDSSPARYNYQILSKRNDVPNLLAAMDVFVFPSIYEGLGISLIEAQKMKLPCFASDKVPEFAKQTEQVVFLPLSNPDNWAKRILAVWQNPDKVNKTELANDWDMKEVIVRLQRMYEGEI